MNAYTLLISVLQSSLLFVLIAGSLMLFLRSPLRHKFSAGSLLLLWVLVLLPLLIPLRFSVPTPSKASNPAVYSFAMAFQRLDPMQYIDWGILESFMDAKLAPTNSEVSSSASSESANPSGTILQLLLGVWLSGVALTTSFYGFQHLALRKLLKESTQVCDDTILAIHHTLLTELNIRRTIPLHQVDGIGTAAIVGLFRPRILLSSGIFKCPPEQLRSILLHELTHFRKAHLWFNGAGMLCTLLHWFNPIVWLSYRDLRRCIELACDEAAIRSQGDKSTPESYAHHLLDLMTQFSSLPSHRLSFLGLFNNIETRFIQQRIVMIKNTSKPKLPLTLVLLIGLCCTAAAFADLTPGENAPPPPPVPEVPSFKTHIDEINLDFDTFNGEPEFSVSAKPFIKEKILPIFKGDDKFLAYQLLLESEFTDDAQVQFLMGSLCLQKNMKVEAERHLINAVNAFPGYRKALKNLIVLYIMSGHKAEAYPLLQKFLKLDPEPDFIMVFMAGVSALALEKYEDAIPLFQKAVELNPTDQNAKINLFQATMLMEDYENAESIIQTIIANETDPEKRAQYHKYYANLALNLENPKLAVQELQITLKLNPTDPEKEAAQKMLKEIYKKNPELK